MAVTAYSTSSVVPVALTGEVPTVVIRLRLPPTGTFVVWGKVVVANTATTAQAGTVQMTTLDGGTSLDAAEFSVGAASGPNVVSVSLQSTLDLSQPNTNEIVDIRCGTASGTATLASLIAIPVDALSGPVGPGS